MSTLGKLLEVIFKEEGFAFDLQLHIFNKTYGNVMDKNIGTLNLIFCSTTFEGINCSQSLSTTLIKVSTLGSLSFSS